jgi:hypothetical protein
MNRKVKLCAILSGLFLVMRRTIYSGFAARGGLRGLYGFFFRLNTVHSPVQMKKKKTQKKCLFECKVTAVYLLITTCISADDFAN